VKSAKWSFTKTIRDHLNTLVDARKKGGRLRVRDIFSFYVIPTLVGLIVLIPQFNWSPLHRVPAYRAIADFRVSGTEGILGGVSIYTALLFGLLVQIFQLKTRFLDEKDSGRDRVIKLNDQLEANVSYAVLIGIATTAFLTFTVATTPKDAPVGRVSSAIIAALMLHLILTLFMVLKRARAVYRDL
jgi:hypothetical protein